MFIQVDPGLSIVSKNGEYLALLSLIALLKSLDEARILTLVEAGPVRRAGLAMTLNSFQVILASWFRTWNGSACDRQRLKYPDCHEPCGSELLVDL